MKKLNFHPKFLTSPTFFAREVWLFHIDNKTVERGDTSVTLAGPDLLCSFGRNNVTYNKRPHGADMVHQSN